MHGTDIRVCNHNCPRRPRTSPSAAGAAERQPSSNYSRAKKPSPRSPPEKPAMRRRLTLGAPQRCVSTGSSHLFLMKTRCHACQVLLQGLSLLQCHEHASTLAGQARSAESLSYTSCVLVLAGMVHQLSQLSPALFTHSRVVQNMQCLYVIPPQCLAGFLNWLSASLFCRIRSPAQPNLEVPRTSRTMVMAVNSGSADDGPKGADSPTRPRPQAFRMPERSSAPTPSRLQVRRTLSSFPQLEHPSPDMIALSGSC